MNTHTREPPYWLWGAALVLRACLTALLLAAAPAHDATLAEL